MLRERGERGGGKREREERERGGRERGKNNATQNTDEKTMTLFNVSLL